MTIRPLFKNTLYFIIVSINFAYGQTTKQAVQQIPPSSAQTSPDAIIHPDTPLSGFYAKYINCSGILIRSANVVDDKALVIAASKVRLMLSKMPEVRKIL